MKLKLKIYYQTNNKKLLAKNFVYLWNQLQKLSLKLFHTVIYDFNLVSMVKWLIQI